MPLMDETRKALVKWNRLSELAKLAYSGGLRYWFSGCIRMNPNDSKDNVNLTMFLGKLPGYEALAAFGPCPLRLTPKPGSTGQFQSSIKETVPTYYVLEVFTIYGQWVDLPVKIAAQQIGTNNSKFRLFKLFQELSSNLVSPSTDAVDNRLGPFQPHQVRLVVARSCYYLSLSVAGRSRQTIISSRFLSTLPGWQKPSKGTKGVFVWLRVDGCGKKKLSDVTFWISTDGKEWRELWTEPKGEKYRKLYWSHLKWIRQKHEKKYGEDLGDGVRSDELD